MNGSSAVDRLENAVDVEDFVNGANLLSGGGGAPTEALRQLTETQAEGLVVSWHPIAELDDEALVVSAFYPGSTDPDSLRLRPSREEERGLVRVRERPLERAVELLENALGRRIDAIIPAEIGASNTAAALDAGTRLSLPVLDGDYAGRAIPSLECLLPFAYDEIDPPLAMVDYYGDELVITQVTSVSMFDTITKMVARATLGRIGAAGLALSGAAVKRLAIRGTVSEALRMGRSLRRAREGGGDVVGSLCDFVSGARLLFEGRLTGTNWSSETGYMKGFHEFGGTGRWAGHDLTVFFQNENHLAWLDGELCIMSPDVIEIVDLGTAEPLVNSDEFGSRGIAMLGLPARAEWTTTATVDLLGPRRWGYDLEYRPFESIEHSYAVREP